MRKRHLRILNTEGKQITLIVIERESVHLLVVGEIVVPTLKEVVDRVSSDETLVGEVLDLAGVDLEQVVNDDEVVGGVREDQREELPGNGVALKSHVGSLPDLDGLEVGRVGFFDDDLIVKDHVNVLDVLVLNRVDEGNALKRHHLLAVTVPVCFVEPEVVQTIVLLSEDAVLVLGRPDAVLQASLKVPCGLVVGLQFRANECVSGGGVGDGQEVKDGEVVFAVFCAVVEDGVVVGLEFEGQFPEGVHLESDAGGVYGNLNWIEGNQLIDGARCGVVEPKGKKDSLHLVLRAGRNHVVIPQCLKRTDLHALHISRNLYGRDCGSIIARGKLIPDRDYDISLHEEDLIGLVIDAVTLQDFLALEGVNTAIGEGGGH